MLPLQDLHAQTWLTVNSTHVINISVTMMAVIDKIVHTVQGVLTPALSTWITQQNHL